MKTDRKSPPLSERKGWAIIPHGVTVEQANVMRVGLGFAKIRFNASDYFTDKKYWTPAAKRFDGCMVHLLCETRDVIAEDAKIDVTSVPRVLAELESLLWMQCVRAPRQGRSRSTGIYIFTPGNKPFELPRSILLAETLSKPKRSHAKAGHSETPKSEPRLAFKGDTDVPKSEPRPAFIESKASPGSILAPLKASPGSMNKYDATKQERLEEGHPVLNRDEGNERRRRRAQEIQETANEYAEAESQGASAAALRLRYGDRRTRWNLDDDNREWIGALRRARQSTTKYKADEEAALTARRRAVVDRFIKGENVDKERKELNLHGVVWDTLLKQKGAA